MVRAVGRAQNRAHVIARVVQVVHMVPGIAVVPAIAVRTVMEQRHMVRVHIADGQTVVVDTHTVVMQAHIGMGLVASHARPDIIAQAFRT